MAILGGGLAGLSLAARIADLPHLRTVIVEPRTTYRRDRTWGYWRLHDHPFRSAVTKRWESWEVMLPAACGAAVTVQSSALVPYEMIPADRLYEAALRVIEGAPHITLRMGCSATGLDEQPDRVIVDTDSGPISAGLLFDGRPPRGEPGGYAQRFLGQEIVAPDPVFDPGRVTLMDFDVPTHPGAVHFLYVLPTSPTHAVVYDTWLAAGDAPLPDYRNAIRDYLAKRFGVTAFEVAFEEEGAIPMDAALQAPRRAGRVIPIGTAGGAIKPSSGYGFLAIQRLADAIARDLGAGRRPAPPRPRSETARWMDAIFLSVLRRSPEEAPRLFHAMFEGCRPEPLVRFLNDVGGPGDVARVIAAMPKGPMIAGALRHLLARA